MSDTAHTPLSGEAEVDRWTVFRNSVAACHHLGYSHAPLAVGSERVATQVTLLAKDVVVYNVNSDAPRGGSRGEVCMPKLKAILTPPALPAATIRTSWLYFPSAGMTRQSSCR